METNIIHKFQEAKLGVAPFRFVRIEIRKYQACHGAPVQPGSSCDYCGTGIMEVCIIRDANGHEFKVGNQCVAKTGDYGLVNTVKRAVNRLRTEARRKREFATITEGRTQLENSPEIRSALAALPHPNEYYAAQGRTLLDYVNFMFQNGGNSGRLQAVRILRKVA